MEAIVLTLKSLIISSKLTSRSREAIEGVIKLLESSAGVSDVSALYKAASNCNICYYLGVEYSYSGYAAHAAACAALYAATKRDYYSRRSSKIAKAAILADI